MEFLASFLAILLVIGYITFLAIVLICIAIILIAMIIIPPLSLYLLYISLVEISLYILLLSTFKKGYKVEYMDMSENLACEKYIRLIPIVNIIVFIYKFIKFKNKLNNEYKLNYSKDTKQLLIPLTDEENIELSNTKNLSDIAYFINYTIKGSHDSNFIDIVIKV